MPADQPVPQAAPTTAKTPAARAIQDNGWLHSERPDLSTSELAGSCSLTCQMRHIFVYSTAWDGSASCQRRNSARSTSVYSPKCSRTHQSAAISLVDFCVRGRLVIMADRRKISASLLHVPWFWFSSSTPFKSASA